MMYTPAQVPRGEKFLVYDTPLEVYSLPYIRMDRWHEYADNRQFEIDNRGKSGWLGTGHIKS